MKKGIKRILFVTIITVLTALLFTCAAFASQRGDITGDSVVDTSDARLTLRYAVGLEDLPFEKYDKADMDMNGKVDTADARAILRTAVELEPYQVYYAPDPNYSLPTCTESASVKKVSTESSATCVIDYEALGHNFLVKGEPPTTACEIPVTVTYECIRCKATKTAAYTVHHEWKAATCKSAAVCKNCGQTNGSPIPHSTRIGYCTMCGEYQDKLEDQRAELVSYLNNARSKFNSAYAAYNDGADSSDKDVEYQKINEAIGLYSFAWDDYKSAWDLCGEYEEFLPIRNIISLILADIGDILTEFSEYEDFDDMADVIEKAYKEVTTSVGTEDGYNLQIKAITDTFKEKTDE